MNPAGSEEKIKSQGTTIELLPTVCTQVFAILPPLAIVAKSAIVPETSTGKLLWAPGISPATTVNVAWYSYPFGHGTTPVPLKPTDCGVLAPLSVIVTTAEKEFADCGVKITV